ncbi:N-acetylmuramoyl-L-alanine amidase [Proteiniphilum propionicum]|uniref:N-acetylmuramoyl-L-alanine amidase n=1 Tax=Proteiniphilum propionicum TaxID=2829812 RepID=UPI001EEB5588|nr:N-acetylmuramoyl-L-alanine amidase [Proteiniphilum propionicum]ULB33003.1 N-acetylmuramoyl-L-alanine amidase [Proteiniphilum propionicum]
MRKINKIIIHCSATPEGRHVTVQDIDRWHRDRGFSQIGYHWVIYLDGSIHKGRSEEIAGAHVVGHNANSVGICYIGGVDEMMRPKDTRTKEQRATMRSLVSSLKNKHPDATVHGHNEFAAKACPSFDVKKEF